MVRVASPVEREGSLRRKEGGGSGAFISTVSESSEQREFPLRTLSLDSTSTWSRIFHSGTAGGGGKTEGRPDLEAAILLRQRLQLFLVTQVLLSNLVRHPAPVHRRRRAERGAEAGGAGAAGTNARGGCERASPSPVPPRSHPSCRRRWFTSAVSWA